MQAFHSNWTRPFFIRNPHMEYRIEPFELLTTALSALEWRRENGSIPHDSATHLPSVIMNRSGFVFCGMTACILC